MIVSVFLLVATICSQCMAYEANLAPQTVHIDSVNTRGWTPKPTAPSVIRQTSRLLKRTQAGLTNTCAWVDGDAVTCPEDLYCAFHDAWAQWGCCSVSDNGNFDPTCVIQTACINRGDSSSICSTASGCIPKETLVCTDTASPDCATLYLPDVSTYWSYLCGTDSGFSTASDNGFTTSRDATGNVYALPVGPLATSETYTDIASDASTDSTSSSQLIFTPTSSTATGLSTSNASAGTQVANQHKSEIGPVVGGAVGGVAGLLIIAGVVGFIVFRIAKKRKEADDFNNGPEMSGAEYVAR